MTAPAEACGQKTRYLSEDSALVAAERNRVKKLPRGRDRSLWKRNGRPVFIYQCPVIDIWGPHWHLTHREQA